MQRTTRTAIILGVLAILCACAPSDDDRCGDGDEFHWDAEGKTCVKTRDTATGADTNSNSEGDASTDSSTTDESPSGLGMVCSLGGGECSGFEADFCTANDMAPEGYCTMNDCSTVDDDCPADYICCDLVFTDDEPHFCLSPEHYEKSGSMICVQ